MVFTDCGRVGVHHADLRQAHVFIGKLLLPAAAVAAQPMSGGTAVAA